MDRKSTIWTFESARASRGVYSTVGDRGVEHCACSAVTEEYPGEVHLGGFMFWIRVYTVTSEELCFGGIGEGTG